MNLSICILGTEVLSISTDQSATTHDPGDSTSQPLGFVASPGDQRWEKGTEQ